MEIRRKLTYQFIGIVAFILLFSFVAIYISFSQSRKEEFYDRLGSKAKLVAQMLVDIDEIDSELLKKIEKNNPLSLSNEKIVIFDYQNKKIFSSDDDNTLLFSEARIQQIRNQEEVRFRQNTYEIFGQFYTGEFDRIVVFVAATDIFGMNKLKMLRIIMLIVFIASLVIVFIAGRMFAMRALAPISNIVKQVNRIEVTNLNARLDKGNETDEIAHLALTFNKLLERLETAFIIQKNFIANASHELRTPLTVITGQLEVVLMKARTNEEYRDTLMLVLNEIKNLNLLSNKLLLLAQTGTTAGHANFLPVRIDDVLWKAQTEVLNRDKNYSIEIIFEDGIDDDSKLSVFGNDLLLKTVIVNLMDNACKYSHNNRAEVRLNVINNLLHLQFSDNGIGIHQDEIKLIFHPFFRSKNVIHVEGHGIGLSLVEKIVAQHKGTVHVSSEPGVGSVFTLQMPIHFQS